MAGALEAVISIIAILVILLIMLVIYRMYIGEKTSFLHPTESNVDKYLDERFENLIKEWEMVTGSQLKGFKNRIKPELETSSIKVDELRKYRDEMVETLDKLEKRINKQEDEGSKKAV